MISNVLNLLFFDSACHVLECLGGLAQDVITTVGQAFEIRFKEYLKNPHRPSMLLTSKTYTLLLDSIIDTVFSTYFFKEEWGNM